MFVLQINALRKCKSGPHSMSKRLSPLTSLLVILVFCVLAEAQDFTKMQVKEPNGVTRYSEPIVSADKTSGEINVYNPSLIEVGGRLAMLYRVDAKGTKGSRIQLAFSDDGRTFVPCKSNPVLVGEGPLETRGCRRSARCYVRQDLLPDLREQRGARSL